MYSGTQRFHAEVKRKHARNPIVCSIILETLSCTLLPDHHNWQVTHVGWKDVQKALALYILGQTENVFFISPFSAVFSVNRHYMGNNARAMSSSFTSLRPCSSAGTLPGSMPLSAEYNRHGFLSRLHFE